MPYTLLYEPEDSDLETVENIEGFDAALHRAADLAIGGAVIISLRDEGGQMVEHDLIDEFMYRKLDAAANTTRTNCNTAHG